MEQVKKIAIFIEGFLWKTQVNIVVTLPIQDMIICNAVTSIEDSLTTTDTDNFLFFSSYQRSLLYTLTTHADSDKQEKENMIKEMNVIHEKW